MGRPNNSFESWVNGAYLIGGQNKTPEEKLFIAVLSQAVHDVFSDHVDGFNRQQAKDFFNNETRHFKLICEMAGRNPDYVYRKIRERMQKKVPSVFYNKIRKPYRQSNL